MPTPLAVLLKCAAGRAWHSGGRPKSGRNFGRVWGLLLKPARILDSECPAARYARTPDASRRRIFASAPQKCVIQGATPLPAVPGTDGIMSVVTPVAAPGEVLVPHGDEVPPLGAHQPNEDLCMFGVDLSMHNVTDTPRHRWFQATPVADKAESLQQIRCEANNWF